MRSFPGKPAYPIASARLQSVPFHRTIDDALVDKLAGFLVGHIREAATVGHKRYVVGLSGGVDSVVAAALAQRSGVEVETVTILIGSQEACAAQRTVAGCAGKLGIHHVEIDGCQVHAAIRAAWPEDGPWSGINIETRAVQTLLFQYADACDAAVIATTDRSEALLGRYTEAFYGHVAPIQALYKSDVWELALLLGVADAVQDARAGCAGHWYDDEVLGVGYDVIDPLLYLMAECGHTAETIASRFTISDIDWLRAIERRVRTHHLRTKTRLPVLDT